jgi:heme exporter protein C
MSAIKPMTMTTTETARPAAGGWPRLLTALTVLSVLGVLGGLYMALVYAGMDVSQGQVQRIFYIHVSAFSGAFVAFSATVIGGIAYLRTRSTKWDTLALAGVEVGFVLSLINLITGMIWARPIWNTWWTWDPRLTSAAIMLLTYAAYLMLRNGIENPEQRRRFASVYGILAMTTVIVTLIIIRLPEQATIHPAVIGPSAQEAKGGFKMASSMIAALGFNSAVYCILVTPTLMWHRIRLQNFSERINHLQAELLDK